MPSKDRNNQIDDSAGHDEKLEDLFKLIESIETGLFTTRRADGRLVSRPMATQLRTEEGHLWFVTDRDTNKLDELENDPQVNVAYYHGRTREWVSISGKARTTTDQAMIDALWAPDWRAWFGEGGGKYSGTAKDPRLVLIEVVPDAVTYMKSDRPMIVTLFELAKGIVTGKAPKFGAMREVSAAELAEGRTAKRPGKKARSEKSSRKKDDSTQSTASGRKSSSGTKKSSKRRKSSTSSGRKASTRARSRSRKSTA